MIVQRVHAAGHSTAVGCLSSQKSKKKSFIFCAKESEFLPPWDCSNFTPNLLEIGQVESVEILLDFRKINC